MRPPGSGVSHLHLHHHAALHARSGRQTRQERVGARSPQSRRPAGRGADAVAGLGEFRRRDRKSVVEGTSVYVRVDLGGRRNIKTKTKLTKEYNNKTHTHLKVINQDYIKRISTE